jgi:putative phosphotransacetylase
VEVTITQAAPQANGAATIEALTREVLRRLAARQAEPPRPAAAVAQNGRLELPVPVGVSVHHVHLCPEHVAILFGGGHDLHIYNELYQKGYFAAKEQVMVVGRRRCLEHVRVLGPTRPYSQVELAQTEAIALGLKLPVATEGAEPGTQPVTIVGPEGAVTLPGGQGGGAFIARRHVHLSDVVAAELGVRQGDLLDLRVDGPRPTTLHGVVVRVRAGWRTEVHLDTDEANATGVRSGQTCTLLIPRQAP